MPIYEYRCRQCRKTSSFYLRTYGAQPDSDCQHCGAAELERIISSVAYLKSEADKMAQLDPKYGRIVDQALARAPRDTDPDHYVKKMVPFSRAKEKGDPYFKE